MSANLYDKYGGFATISALVHDFYERIGNTPALDRYFVGADMGKLIGHQTRFLCMVLGGPAEYTGRQLGAAHRNLAITSEHYDLVAAILEDTLIDGGVENADVRSILGVVASHKAQIVTVSTIAA